MAKMKKAAALGVAAIMTVAACSLASAATPEYYYECVKSSKAVTVDGKASAGEWDDANELVVNADNEEFKKHGQWQGSTGAGAADLSITYRIKWDDDNLYILEQRMDKNYTPGADAKAPWTCDGTLFFLAADNGGTVKNDTRFEAFWVNQATDGKAKAAARLYKGGAGVVTDASDTWQYAGGKDGDVYTIEMVIPWKNIQDSITGTFEVKAGQAFRFTPIVPDMLDGVFSQINFYVDKSNADNPDGWGGLMLVNKKGEMDQYPLPTAPPTTKPEEKPTEAAKATTTKTQTTTTQANASGTQSASSQPAEESDGIPVGVIIGIVAAVVVVAGVVAVVMVRKKKAEETK